MQRPIRLNCRIVCLPAFSSQKRKFFNVLQFFLSLTRPTQIQKCQTMPACRAGTGGRELYCWHENSLVTFRIFLRITSTCFFNVVLWSELLQIYTRSRPSLLLCHAQPWYVDADYYWPWLLYNCTDCMWSPLYAYGQFQNVASNLPWLSPHIDIDHMQSLWLYHELLLHAVLG